MHSPNSRTLDPLGLGLALFTLLFAAGCAHYAQAPSRSAIVERPAQRPFELLASSDGPVRFAQVSPHLYRGGQPTAAHLAALAQLGVRTIIDLRSEGEDAREAEEAEVRRLGLNWEPRPLSGLGRPPSETLRDIVDAIRRSPGPVYVHCKLGRDRTSLVVALYRVLVEGQPAEWAWQHEALDYGHRPGLFLRGLGAAYLEITRALQYSKMVSPSESEMGARTGR